MATSVATIWRVGMSKSDVEINVDELAPMDNPEEPVQLNVRSMHATIVLIQEALYRLEKRVEELTP